MATDDTSVTLDEADLAYARRLVDEGAYVSVDEAVRGELLRAQDLREEEYRTLEAEVRERRKLPRDQWIEAQPGHFTRWFDATFRESGESGK